MLSLRILAAALLVHLTSGAAALAITPCPEQKTEGRQFADLMDYAFAIQGLVMPPAQLQRNDPPPPPKRKKIEAKECRTLNELIEKPSVSENRDVHLFIQLGFFDDPEIRNSLSVDPQIAENLVTLMKFCGFDEGKSSSDQHQIFEKSIEGAPGSENRKLKITLGRASRDGRYEPSFSEQAHKLFFETHPTADYLITVGHSRKGLGLDLFATKEKYKKTIPIYSKNFFENKSGRLKGAAILGCDSEKYLHQTKQTQSSVQLIDVRGNFYSTGSIDRIFDVIEEFR